MNASNFFKDNSTDMVVTLFGDKGSQGAVLALSSLHGAELLKAKLDKLTQLPTREELATIMGVLFHGHHKTYFGVHLLEGTVQDNLLETMMELWSTRAIIQSFLDGNKEMSDELYDELKTQVGKLSNWDHIVPLSTIAERLPVYGAMIACAYKVVKGSSNENLEESMKYLNELFNSSTANAKAIGMVETFAKYHAKIMEAFKQAVPMFVEHFNNDESDEKISEAKAEIKDLIKEDFKNKKIEDFEKNDEKDENKLDN